MKFYWLPLCWFCLGCQSPVTEEKLPWLNGYWEIQRVEFPNGGSKEYGANTTVDFVKIQAGKGFRKKVQPSLTGSYSTSDDAVPFRLEKSGDAYFLHYETEEGTWKEKLLSLSQMEFSVEDAEGLAYFYSRYEPIQLP